MRAVPVSRSLVFLAIASIGFTADLVTKKLMFPKASVSNVDVEIDWIWKNIAGFQNSLNEGALFGLGQGFVPLFAGLSIVAAIGIFIWLFYAGAARDWLLTVALGCVTAGIFGNLYDRLGFPGLVWNGMDGIHTAGTPVYAVRDFVLVMIGSWRWPNFNVADSFLVCGAILLFWQALRSNRNAEREEEKPAEK